MKTLLSFAVIIVFTGFIGYKAYDVASSASVTATAVPDRLELRKAELYDYFSATIFRYLPLPESPQDDGIPRPRT